MNSSIPLEVVSFVAPEDKSSDSRHPLRCKFVLLSHHASLVLILGPITRYAYHADLLAAYCDSHQILTMWDRHPDTLRIKDPEIAILGGGHLAWNLPARQARFGGSSKAYGPIDLDSLPELLSGAELFAGHQITVE